MGDNIGSCLHLGLQAGSMATQIEHLSLRQNRLTDLSLVPILQSLAVEGSLLQHLDLANNTLMGPQSALALVEVMKMCSGLTQVNVEGNGLGDDGVIVLCEGLRENTSVTTLRLGSNGIRKDGAEAIAGG